MVFYIVNIASSFLAWDFVFVKREANLFATSLLLKLFFALVGACLFLSQFGLCRLVLNLAMLLLFFLWISLLLKKS